MHQINLILLLFNSQQLQIHYVVHTRGDTVQYKLGGWNRPSHYLSPVPSGLSQWKLSLQQEACATHDLFFNTCINHTKCMFLITWTDSKCTSLKWSLWGYSFCCSAASVGYHCSSTRTSSQPAARPGWSDPPVPRKESKSKSTVTCSLKRVVKFVGLQDESHNNSLKSFPVEK